MAVTDTHGRRINYLRLSITDRCNLRCTYCIPAEGIRRLPPADVLTTELLADVFRVRAVVGTDAVTGAVSVTPARGARGRRATRWLLDVGAAG